MPGTGKRRGTGRTLIQQSRSIAPSEKAAFHQITGAGKSHVLRPFFGLNADDEEAIVTRIETVLTRVLKAGQ